MNKSELKKGEYYHFQSEIGDLEYIRLNKFITKEVAMETFKPEFV